MHEPKQSKQKRVVYYPPPPAVVDKFARQVCNSLAQKYGQPAPSTKMINDLSEFFKIIVEMKIQQLNHKGVKSRGKNDET